VKPEVGCAVPHLLSSLSVESVASFTSASPASGPAVFHVFAFPRMLRFCRLRRRRPTTSHQRGFFCRTAYCQIIRSTSRNSREVLRPSSGDLARGSWVPPVDIYSNGQHELVLKAELPDMKEEEIKLTAEDNTLTLRGERKLDTEVTEEQFQRMERRYGSFARSYEWTLHLLRVACSNVICSDFLFTARPFRAIVDSSQDLPRTGRLLHRRSRKAGPVPRVQSILLIEPDDHSRVMYAEYLHTFGFTVQTADTTDDGLMRASDADVIVTGIRVPGSFDGVELVRRVRQTDGTKHTPIIVLLTACAFESDQQRAFAAGCDLFLPKHCPPERLASEIRAVGATTLKDVEVISNKPHRRPTKKVVTMPTVVPDALPATMTDRDIARRAYDLYLIRGCEHGHDVEDWLRAERDLRDAMSSTAA
jgi:CheY-like chemotaxis protein/HSP20 family molecular chaperone IbpA